MGSYIIDKLHGAVCGVIGLLLLKSMQCTHTTSLLYKYIMALRRNSLINKKKKIRPIYNETYDEIAVKTASKCLAHMKACWDPEFEPSVEEIMDY